MERISTIYSNIVYNDAVINFDEKVGLWPKIKLGIYVIVLLLKSLFARKNKDAEPVQKTIALSWSDLHMKRINWTFPNIAVLDISRKGALTNPQRYARVNIRRVLTLTIKVPSNRSFKHLTLDSYWYKVFIALEHEMLRKLTQQAEEVIVAGHFDRYIALLSDLSFENNFKLSIVQHGCIRIHDQPLKRATVNGDFFYMYKFSVPYFKTFAKYTSNSRFHDQRIEHSINFSEENDTKGKKRVVFVCQDKIPDNNKKIINEIIRLQAKGNYVLQIMPHPREKIQAYREYRNQPSVFVSTNKKVRPDMVFTRFSTLGVEYAKAGIDTVFVNLDRVNMDFLFSLDFNEIKDIKDIEKHIKTL